MHVGWTMHRWWAWWGLNHNGEGRRVLDLGPLAIYFG